MSKRAIVRIQTSFPQGTGTQDGTPSTLPGCHDPDPPVIRLGFETMESRSRVAGMVRF